MTDINQIDFETLDKEEIYFIIGKRFDGCTTNPCLKISPIMPIVIVIVPFL